MKLETMQKDKNCAFAGHKRFEFGPFCQYHDLKEDTLASFDVKVAAACLMVHCSANSSACSGSKIVVEWSGTIVTVFYNAVFGWDCFFHWNVIICRCDRDQKSQHWNDFHVFDFRDLVFWYERRGSGRFDTQNIFCSSYIARMRHNFGAAMEPESPKLILWCWWYYLNWSGARCIF